MHENLFLVFDSCICAEVFKNTSAVALLCNGNLFRHGYHNRVISRPELYNFLVDQIPAEKIQLGKQVAHVEQDDDAATCICTDGSKYRGIIIGADGAYSAVRLSLYKDLKERGLLPARDYRPMWYRSKALVGMTRPDPERFGVLGTTAYFSDVKVLVSRGDTPFTVQLLTYCKQMCNCTSRIHSSRPQLFENNLFTSALFYLRASGNGFFPCSSGAYPCRGIEYAGHLSTLWPVEKWKKHQMWKI